MPQDLPRSNCNDSFTNYQNVTIIVEAAFACRARDSGQRSNDWRAQQQVVDQLVRWPNGYADTSGVRRFDYLVQATRRAGPNKLLFGSDGPWLHPAVELHKIKLLGLPKSEEELVTGDNVLRLIGET